MKWTSFGFISFLLFSLTFGTYSFATITISSIGGASAVGSLTANPVDVYGGISGNSTTTCTTTPCNSCGTNNFAACNERMISQPTILTITFKSDTTSGTMRILDDANTPLTLTGTTAYTSGSTGQASIVWGTLCAEVTGDTTCTTDTGTKTLKFGIDTGADNTLEDSYSITFRIAGIPLTTATESFASSTDGYGVVDFALYPGDQKAYIDDDYGVEVLNDNYSLPNAEIVSLRAFYEEATVPAAACATTVTNGSPSYSLPLTGGTTNKAIEDNRIDADLENDRVYKFVLGMQDAAGNIGYFFNAAGDADSGPCVIDQHTVQPREVYGLLEENQNCFISTAAFGSPLNEKVVTFRNFRDQVLAKFTWGKKLIQFYYKNSPPLADKIKNSPPLKIMTQVLLWPLWLMSWIVLRIGLVAFSVLLILFLVVIRLNVKKKIHAPAKTTSFFLIFGIVFSLFFGLPEQTIAQESFFDLNSSETKLPQTLPKKEAPTTTEKAPEASEKPPQEPPYSGTEVDEFDDLENTAEESVESEPAAQEEPDIENYVESPSKNPNKWKKYQRVPEEKRLEELSQEGLFKISKKGEYLYRVDQSPQNSAASVRLGVATFPYLANPASGVAFQDIYGDQNQYMLMGEYEWQIFQRLGKLGIKVGSGILVASGDGQLAYEFDSPIDGLGNPTTDGKERYSLYMFPNSLSLIYRLDIWNKQWIVPYAEAGLDYFAFVEARDDGEDIKFGASPHFHLAAGGSFLLDVINRESMIQIDKDYGVNHIWLTAEYRRIELISGDFDFTDDIFSAGLTLEY